jgi:hypothetical protein
LIGGHQQRKTSVLGSVTSLFRKQSSFLRLILKTETFVKQKEKKKQTKPVKPSSDEPD